MSGIIFDLDGTLIDSAPDIHAAAVAMMRSEGLPEPTFTQTRSFIGNGIPRLVERVLAAMDVAEEPGLTARLTARIQADLATTVNLTTIYPGAEACLRQLHADGFQLALCTNKPELPTRAVLDHFGITGLFDALAYGDGPYPRKPDAAPVRHVIGQMQAARFLYVGDSEVDAATAENAGLPMALFTEGYRKTPVDALTHDVAFNHFDQLRGIIDRLVPLPE